MHVESAHTKAQTLRKQSASGFEWLRHHAGLYQAGAQNQYFSAKALAGWVLNAAFQAGCMVAIVLAATAPTTAAQANGSTWSHWEVGPHLCCLVWRGLL